MPNSKDLGGLQVRQVAPPERKLLFYSRNSSYMCTIYQGGWVFSLRVSRGTLPVYKELGNTDEVLKVQCAKELEGRTIEFYVPPIQYLPAIVR